jgi:hypothetical protein
MIRLCSLAVNGREAGLGRRECGEDSLAFRQGMGAGRRETLAGRKQSGRSSLSAWSGLRRRLRLDAGASRRLTQWRAPMLFWQGRHWSMCQQ